MMDSKQRLVMQLWLADTRSRSLGNVVRAVRSVYGEDAISELTEEEAKADSVNYGIDWESLYAAFGKPKGHVGSNFDDFLKEEGILDDVTRVALQRIADNGGRYIKRTNWTTEEVIKILEGCKLTCGDGSTEELPVEFKNMNLGIDHCIDKFSDFLIDENVFGALGYCPEEDVIYHIGPLPNRD